MSIEKSVLFKEIQYSGRIVQLAVAVGWLVEDAQASPGQGGRAPASGPALGVRRRKAPGATVQDPATHRHCWQQAITVLTIGLGGFPPLLSLHSVARQSCARSVAEAALSLSVRTARSSACRNVKAFIKPPAKHDSCHAGQPQVCLRAVRRQCPRPTAHRSRLENISHERQPTMLQILKQVVGSSPRDRTDGDRLQTTSKM